MSVYESGRAFVKKFEVTAEGGQYNLAANAKELHFVVDGSINIYLSKEDFDADNGWPITGSPGQANQQRFPIALSTVWMRGDGADATVTILVVAAI